MSSRFQVFTHLLTYSGKSCSCLCGRSGGRGKRWLTTDSLTLERVVRASGRDGDSGTRLLTTDSLNLERVVRASVVEVVAEAGDNQRQALHLAQGLPPVSFLLSKTGAHLIRTSNSAGFFSVSNYTVYITIFFFHNSDTLLLILICNTWVLNLIIFYELQLDISLTVIITNIICATLNACLQLW